jgi:hypothetical protein
MTSNLELVQLLEVCKGGDCRMVINEYLQRPRGILLHLAGLLEALPVSFAWERNRPGSRSIVSDSSRSSCRPAADSFPATASSARPRHPRVGPRPGGDDLGTSASCFSL